MRLTTVLIDDGEVIAVGDEQAVAVGHPGGVVRQNIGDFAGVAAEGRDNPQGLLGICLQVPMHDKLGAIWSERPDERRADLPIMQRGRDEPRGCAAAGRCRNIVAMANAARSDHGGMRGSRGTNAFDGGEIGAVVAAPTSARSTPRAASRTSAARARMYSSVSAA